MWPTLPPPPQKKDHDFEEFDSTLPEDAFVKEAAFSGHMVFNKEFFYRFFSIYSYGKI